MLVVKAYINTTEIEEIHIWNTGNCVDEEMDIWEYKIVKPTGREDVPIFHHRYLGWRPLFSNVITVLERFTKEEEE